MHLPSFSKISTQKTYLSEDAIWQNTLADSTPGRLSKSSSNWASVAICLAAAAAPWYCSGVLETPLLITGKDAIELSVKEKAVDEWLGDCGGGRQGPNRFIVIWAKGKLDERPTVGAGWGEGKRRRELNF